MALPHQRWPAGPGRGRLPPRPQGSDRPDRPSRAQTRRPHAPQTREAAASPSRFTVGVRRARCADTIPGAAARVRPSRQRFLRVNTRVGTDTVTHEPSPGTTPPFLTAGEARDAAALPSTQSDPPDPKPHLQGPVSRSPFDAGAPRRWSQVFPASSGPPCFRPGLPRP